MIDGRPVKTYEVEIDGYAPILYSGRTPGKARARAWQDFSAVYACSFHDFLVRSRIRLVPDPPGYGSRMRVCGKPATKVIGSGGVNSSAICFMYDGSHTIMRCHEMEVTPL